MYQALLIFHSATRWLVLLSLAYSVFRAYKGYSGGHTFTKQDDTVRHVTATVTHIQLMIGFTLYFQSPNKVFLATFPGSSKYRRGRFFWADSHVFHVRCHHVDQYRLSTGQKADRASSQIPDHALMVFSSINCYSCTYPVAVFTTGRKALCSFFLILLKHIIYPVNRLLINSV